MLPSTLLSALIVGCFTSLRKGRAGSSVLLSAGQPPLHSLGRHLCFLPGLFLGVPFNTPPFPVSSLLWQLTRLPLVCLSWGAPLDPAEPSPVGALLRMRPERRSSSFPYLPVNCSVCCCWGEVKAVRDWCLYLWGDWVGFHPHGSSWAQPATTAGSPMASRACCCSPAATASTITASRDSEATP